MTKYEVVRDTATGPERHPDQPANGFDSATAANLWVIQHDLDGAWHIRPVAADAQPARFGGIQ